MNQVVEGFHIKCRKCGYVLIPENEEMEHKLVMLATIGLSDGSMQKNARCDKCKEKGHLVAIGSSGEEIPYWGEEG